MANENENLNPQKLANQPTEDEHSTGYTPTTEELAFFSGDIENTEGTVESADDTDMSVASFPDKSLEVALQRLNPETVPKIADDLVADYRAFQEALHPEVGVVYHPCGANDMSPSAAFPGSKVLYADLDDRSMEALRKDGLDAQTVDATKFDPGPVDVLLMLNPVIGPEGPASHVKVGGYAMVNNYHGTASRLRKDGTFELVGIVHDRTSDGSSVLDTDNPQDYWADAETDEEFHASTGYRGIGYLTQDFTGTTTPSLEQYKAAIEEARKKPGAYESDGYIWYERGTRMVPCGMPPKKGHMDDFFVFRRTAEVADSSAHVAHIAAVAVENS